MIRFDPSFILVEFFPMKAPFECVLRPKLSMLLLLLPCTCWAGVAGLAVLGSCTLLRGTSLAFALWFQIVRWVEVFIQYGKETLTAKGSGSCVCVTWEWSVSCLCEESGCPAGVLPPAKAHSWHLERTQQSSFVLVMFGLWNWQSLKCEYCNNMFSWIVVFKKDFCEAIDLSKQKN